MGSDVRPNLGVSTLLWHALLVVCRSKSDQAEGFPESSRWIMAGAYFAFGYVLGLRGPEGFLLEIKKLSKNKEHTGGLVWLPLMVILKGDNSTGTHYMRSVPLTDTGVVVALWRDDLQDHVGFARGEKIKINNKKPFPPRTSFTDSIV